MSKRKNIKTASNDYFSQQPQVELIQEEEQELQNQQQQSPQKKRIRVRKRIIAQSTNQESLTQAKKQFILARKFQKSPSPVNPIPGTMYADFLLENKPQTQASQFLSLDQNIIYSDNFQDCSTRPISTGSAISPIGQNNIMMGPRFDQDERIIPRSIVGDPQSYIKKYKELKKEMTNRVKTEKKKDQIEGPSK